MAISRFTNLISEALRNFEVEKVWKNIKELRTNYLKSNMTKENDTCQVFIQDEHINVIIKEMAELMKLSNASDDIQELEKESIDVAAKMFIYLNSCPDSYDNWKDYPKIFIWFGDISKLVLSMFKVISKSMSVDAKNILLKFLSNSSEKFGFQYLSTLIKQTSG